MLPTMSPEVMLLLKLEAVCDGIAEFTLIGQGSHTGGWVCNLTVSLHRGAAMLLRECLQLYLKSRI
jgi:hypothetical protein